MKTFFNFLRLIWAVIGHPIVTFLVIICALIQAPITGNWGLAFASLFLPCPAVTSLGAAGAELLTRYFSTEIMPLLFPSSNFLSRARNDDAFVNNNTVELPHSGTIPGATVNRVILPAPIAPRSDTPSNYSMEEITVDPVLIGTSESLTIAYNKRASILDQQAKVINAKVTSRALQKWAAGADTAHKIASTGAARAAGNSNGAQTGNRKALTLADIVNVQLRFMRDDIQNDIGEVNGIGVITPAMYGDLIQLSQFNEAQKFGRAIIPSGVVTRALGFDWYVRSLVTVLDVSNVLKAEGAAGATTDQDAAVFYHPDYVRRAVGSYVPFVNENKAEYYGSLFSALQRFGAAPARIDNKGVVLLFESN